MHRTLTTAAVVLAGMAFATGCSSSSTQDSVSAGAYGNSNVCTPGTVCGTTTVTYGMFGPAADAPSEGYFFFGAGDALGEEVFTYYVASIRAEQEEYYATGESFFPDME